MLKLQQIRKDKNITQSDIAKQIGISERGYRNIEYGISNPSYNVLVKLENLFNLSHRKLFAVVPEKSNKDM